MKGKKNRAAGTAPKNNQLNQSYRDSLSMSIVKQQIGELLLFGDKECKEFWKLLQVLLKQFCELKY